MKKITSIICLLIMAACMSMAGIKAWEYFGYSNPRNYTGLIPASCATWLMLSPLLIRRSVLLGIPVGLLSPFVGVVVFVLLGVLANVPKGPAETATRILSSGGIILFGWQHAVLSAAVTLPIGGVTGFLASLILRTAFSEQSSEVKATYGA